MFMLVSLFGITKGFLFSLPVFVIQLEFTCSLACSNKRSQNGRGYSKHCDVSFLRAKPLQILIEQVECSPPPRMKCTSLH